MSGDFYRISVNSSLMNGQPAIRGMRLTVQRVVQAAANYADRNQLKAEYPALEDENIRQALEFVASNLDGEIIAPGVA